MSVTTSTVPKHCKSQVLVTIVTTAATVSSIWDLGSESWVSGKALSKQNKQTSKQNKTMQKKMGTEAMQKSLLQTGEGVWGRGWENEGRDREQCPRRRGVKMRATQRS